MEHNNTSLTPMMQQFFKIKNQHPDFLLFFRLGDFYELFDTDAIIAAPILGIALTKRVDIPMCGIPYHAKNNYLYKLIKENHKVAICEQVEILGGTKKIFDRKVVELITPGTFSDESFQKEDKEHFLMSFATEKENAAFCFADVSTGKLTLLVVPNEEEEIAAILEKFDPSEIIYQEKPSFKLFNSYYQNILPSYLFNTQENTNFLQHHFNTKTLKAYNLENPLLINVCGAALKYLKNNLLNDIAHLNKVELLHNSDFIFLSESTIKSLELLKDANQLKPQFSLYTHLNNTKTAMGARFLRHSITHPLTSKELIEKRLNGVEIFVTHRDFLSQSREILKKIPDLERLLGKIALQKANPQDVFYFLEGLIFSQKLKTFSSIKNLITSEAEDLSVLIQLIDQYLVENPPLQFGEEPVIKKNFSEELDALRKKALDSYSVLLEIEEREKEKNALPKLRLKYSKQLGYYFEIPKGQTEKIPSYFISKQSLTNLERYTIKELINFENEVLESKNLLEKKEKELFNELLSKILEYITCIKSNIEFIKEWDLLASFAITSIEQEYIKPLICEKIELIIKEGRHPVVEKFVENFTANSVELDDSENKLLLISGPNMAGKSTFLRQTALIALMAHLGCFVPALQAQIPLIDKIFTRIGASDNLSKGESTFLVEMSETAEILNNCTPHSLIIMDEIGRGTSTHDGLSLAWAIVEYLGNSKQSHGMVLFATHYHELWTLEKNTGIKNFHVSVNDVGGKLVFLHKVLEGFADKSYGIHVAQIAGIASSIIQRATQILESLETHLDQKIQENLIKKPLEIKQELDSFDKKTSDYFPVLEKIQKLNINTITPLQALNLLQELKKTLDINIKRSENKGNSLFEF